MTAKKKRKRYDKRAKIPKSVKTGLRLFCVGAGDTFKYSMYASLAEARIFLGPAAHSPNSDELRFIWIKDRISEMTPAQVRQKYGISRQAVAIWRQRAGMDIPTLTEHQATKRRAQIKEHLSPEKSAHEIGLMLRVSATKVREVAAEAGVQLADKRHRKPADDEIVQLAKGRTWTELADACGITLASLRAYIYDRRNAKLLERIRKNIRRIPQWKRTPIDTEACIRMYSEGLTAYAIAKLLKADYGSVINRLKKVGVYVRKQDRTENMARYE